MSTKYFLSVGSPEVAVEIMSLKEAQQRHLRQTSSKRVRSVEPGGAFMVNANVCPIIVATAGLKMVVACAKNTSTIGKVVTAIIRTLKRKAPYQRIVICMQFGDATLESAFMGHVQRARIWHSWAMFSRDSYPPIARAHKGAVDPDEWSLIRVKRDA